MTSWNPAHKTITTDLRASGGQYILRRRLGNGRRLGWFGRRMIGFGCLFAGPPDSRATMEHPLTGELRWIARELHQALGLPERAG